MVGVAFICCTFVAKIKCHSINQYLKDPKESKELGSSPGGDTCFSHQ